MRRELTEMVEGRQLTLHRTPLSTSAPIKNGEMNAPTPKQLYMPDINDGRS